MSQIIIDASVTVAWLLNEEPFASHVKREFNSSALIAPWLWRLEVTNAILVYERRKLLTHAEGVELLRSADDIPIELIPEPKDRSAVLLAQFARPYQLTSYDVVYLELATTLNLPLFTADKNLRAAAIRAGVKLIPEK